MENSQLTHSIYKPVLAKPINRLAAFFLDFVLFVILVTGSLFISSKIAHFDEHNQVLHEQYRAIGYELYDEENDRYYLIDQNDENFEIVYEKYKTNEIIAREESYLNQFTLNAPLVSILLAMLIVEILIPLILKNGQTLGMKCLRVALISNTNIAVKPLQVFIRGLLGKTVLLALIPFMCLFFAFFNPNGGLGGMIILSMIYLIDFICIFATKYKTGLQDIIAQVYPVDFTQTVFYATVEELNKAIKEEEKMILTKKKVY